MHALMRTLGRLGSRFCQKRHRLPQCEAKRFRADGYFTNPAFEQLETRALLSITPITTDANNHRWPSLNNDGDIVYSAQVNGLWQVFKNGQQVTNDGHNNMYPVISDNDDIVYFKDGGSGGLGWQVVRRSANGSESQVEKSTSFRGKHRDAGRFSGIASDGTSITSYTFYDFSAVRRFNVSGVGRLTADFFPWDYPDINASREIVYSGFGSVRKASVSSPYPGTTVASATMARINDSGDLVTVSGDLESSGQIEILGAPSYTQRTAVSDGVWADINASRDVVFEDFDANGMRQIYLFEETVVDVALLTAELATDTLVTYTFQTEGGIGSFDVGLYESQDGLFDGDDVQVGILESVTPSGGRESLEFSLSQPFSCNPTRPYLLMVVDPERQIDEEDEDNNTQPAHGTVDLDPLRFVGCFESVAGSNQRYQASGVIRAGLKPVEGEQFLPVLTIDGDVAYDSQEISSSGTVSASIGGVAAPLFAGDWNVIRGQAHTAVLNEFAQMLPDEFRIAGVDIAIEHMALVNPSGGATSDAQLELQGTITMPEALGGAALDVTNPHKVVISQGGVGLTGGKLSFPPIELNLLDLLEVSVTDLSVEYVADPEMFKIQGQVNVPTLYGFAADFTGNNVIQVTNDTGSVKVDVVGELSVKDIPIVPGVWELNEAKLTFDTVANKVGGGAKLLIPTGIVVGAEVGFANGQFNFVKILGESLNLPVGTTGAYLQSVEGQVDHIAEADPDPIEFGGGVGITAGPEIDVSLPSWADGGYSGSLVRLDVTGRIDKNLLTAGGTITIVGGLASGEASAELSWVDDVLKADGSFQYLGGLVDMDAGFTADASFDVTMLGSARVHLPDIGFPLLGQEIASGNGYFQYRNDSDSTNDYVMGYGVLTLPCIGPICFGDVVVGAKIDFSGDWSVITGEDQIPPSSPAFQVNVGTERLLLTAEWENDVGAVGVSIVAPDGTVFSQSDIDAAATMAMIGELSSQTTTTIAILNPVPGKWTIVLEDTSGLGNVRYFGSKPSEPPTITISDAVNDLASHTANIGYTAFDGDSNASVSLFYDNDASGFDGVLIAEGLPEADGPGNYVWDTSLVPPGQYYVYGLIDDGNNPLGFDYSPATRIGEDHPPEIIDILLSGQAWDENVASFSLLAASKPDQPLPWVNMDRIDVVFSEDVEVELSSLTLAGVNGTEYSPIGFSYSQETFTASWWFDPPFAADRLLLNLAGEATDPSPVRERVGTNAQLLGGGSDFELRFVALPGDSTGDGVTDIGDLVNIATRVPSSVGPPPSGSYSPEFDVNGDGRIDIGDLVNTATRVPSSLPGGEPGTLNLDAAVFLAVAPPWAAGDANRDGRFDRLDVVLALQAAKDQTGQPATWSEGDWDRNGVFDEFDIITALQGGQYLEGTPAAITADETRFDFGLAGRNRSGDHIRTGEHILDEQLAVDAAWEELNQR